MLLGVEGKSYIIDQDIVAGVFYIIYVCLFYKDVPYNVSVDKKAKDPPTIIEEDLSIIVNILNKSSI